MSRAIMFAAAAGLSAWAAPASARPAECYVGHAGVVAFSGSCDFQPEGPAGSFVVTDDDTNGVAALRVIAPRVGKGLIITGPRGGASTLETEALRFDDGCWENGDSVICAW